MANLNLIILGIAYILVGMATGIYGGIHLGLIAQIPNIFLSGAGGYFVARGSNS